MRRKLQDLANSLCPMAIGESNGIDLDAICDFLDGTIEIDLLGATASHSVSGAILLPGISELGSWLRARLEAISYPESQLRVARITATYRTDRIPTNRRKLVSFDWKCEAIVETDGAAYRSPIMEKHLLYTRKHAAE